MQRETETMQNQAKVETESVEEFLGEWHPLVAQLGSADGMHALGTATASLKQRRVQNIEALKGFLLAYQTQILVPIELPAIQRGFLHASRNETRELIAFDREVSQEPLLKNFLAASERVGQYHLKRLRPLRDVRLIQRYIRAVEGGQAHGWHTLVYGMTLSVYSLPVRQGLASYERQTLRGFMNPAARSLKLTEKDFDLILEDLCGEMPQASEGETRQEFDFEAVRE